MAVTVFSVIQLTARAELPVVEGSCDKELVVCINLSSQEVVHKKLALPMHYLHCYSCGCSYVWVLN